MVVCGNSAANQVIKEERANKYPIHVPQKAKNRVAKVTLIKISGMVSGLLTETNLRFRQHEITFQPTRKSKIRITKISETIIGSDINNS
jgi:hypothetical protein